MTRSHLLLAALDALAYWPLVGPLALRLAGRIVDGIIRRERRRRGIA